MVTAGERDIDIIVAIHSDGEGNYRLLSPCGRCRELISDFDLEANVIVGTVDRPQKVPILELLPMKTNDGAA